MEGSFVSTERQEDDVGAAGNAEQKWEARNETVVDTAQVSVYKGWKDENNNAGKAKDEGPSTEESVSEYTFLSQHDHRR